MGKRLCVGCGAVAAALLVTGQVARASLDSEPFADSSYVLGTPLSAANWTAGGNTTGALTIATGPTSPNHSEGEAAATGVRLDGGASTLTARYDGWGGPPRNTSGTEPENGRDYFSIDVFKGTGTATGLVWNVTFINGQTGAGNPKTLVALQGGLGTVQMLAYDTNVLTYTGPLINLQNGWNNICIINDITNPLAPADSKNVHLYLNTNLDANGNPLSNAVDSTNIANGPLASSSGSSLTNRILLSRLGNATGTATMYFDNVITADMNVDPTDGVLPGLGIDPAHYFASYAPTPEPTTLLLFGCVVPLLSRRLCRQL